MIRVEAPAKVNLYLHVTGRRADGYHLLDSLVVFAGAGDTLEITAADGLALHVDGPTAPLLPAGDNIVLNAARALAAHAGIIPRANLRLTKRLPVAAGIGGGSADAAATLHGLNQLWGLDLSDETLAKIGLGLGADVPVCVVGRPAALSGVGENLAPVPSLPPAWLVLVNPREPLATPAVFKARQGAFSDCRPLTRSPADARDLAAMLGRRGNDLTRAAITLVPVVGEVLALLAAQSQCLLARMSGSGATCFGLFGNRVEAEAAAEKIAAARPGWWVVAAPLLC